MRYDTMSLKCKTKNGPESEMPSFVQDFIGSDETRYRERLLMLKGISSETKRGLVSFC
jgi:hypothetical protein